MAMRVRLAELLTARGMTSRELAERIGITQANLSLLRQGKVKGIRFATLAAICEHLECQPGDLLRYEKGEDGS